MSPDVAHNYKRVMLVGKDVNRKITFFSILKSKSFSGVLLVVSKMTTCLEQRKMKPDIRISAN